MPFQYAGVVGDQREKKDAGVSSESGNQTGIGPHLVETLELQCIDEVATSYPCLESYGRRLASLCEMHGDPVVWPVGDAAERLAGAAALLSEGRLRLRGWSDDLAGQQVLLVGTAAATPLALLAAASQARALGATTVHGCAIELREADPEALGDVLDSYSSLEVETRGPERRSATGHRRPVVAS